MFCDHCKERIKPSEEDNLVADSIFCDPCYKDFWRQFGEACAKLDAIEETE